MIQSVFIGAMGISGQQRRMDVIADNLSNVNTLGFKSATFQFKDALHEAYPHPVDKNSTNNLQFGFGVLDASTNRDFRTGQVFTSLNNLDFAIDGPGFFAFQDTNGETVYSRNGTLAISNEADGPYLVNQQGCYLLDAQGQRIKIQGDISQFEVSPNGDVHEGKNLPYAKIPIYDFPNNYGLNSIGRGFYTPSANSGEAVQIVETNSIMQNMNEGSNVNVALEMTRMIRTQRALQFASRAVKVADEMEGMANNIRG